METAIDYTNQNTIYMSVRPMARYTAHTMVVTLGLHSSGEW
jgi:hypothetical protein